MDDVVLGERWIVVPTISEFPQSLVLPPTLMFFLTVINMLATLFIPARGKNNYGLGLDKALLLAVLIFLEEKSHSASQHYLQVNYLN